MRVRVDDKQYLSPSLIYLDECVVEEKRVHTRTARKCICLPAWKRRARGGEEEEQREMK